MFWHEMNSHEIPQESKLISKKMKRHQVSWDKMTWGAKSWDEVRRAEMRWKNSEDMRWVEMRWDDTDCGDSGMQWAISKRSCDAMRSDEMRKDSTFERQTSQEPVATKHRRLACHLYTQPLLRSTGYTRFKFETSAPGLPGYYLYMWIYVDNVFWDSRVLTISFVWMNALDSVMITTAWCTCVTFVAPGSCSQGHQGVARHQLIPPPSHPKSELTQHVGHTGFENTRDEGPHFTGWCLEVQVVGPTTSAYTCLHSAQTYGVLSPVRQRVCIFLLHFKTRVTCGVRTCRFMQSAASFQVLFLQQLGSMQSSLPCRFRFLPCRRVQSRQGFLFLHPFGQRPLVVIKHFPGPLLGETEIS